MIVKNVNNLKRDEVDKIKPYIPGKPISEVKSEYGLDKVVKLASNENPLDISTKVEEAIKKELNSIGLYPDGGCRLLKGKLAEKYGIDEDMIIFGNGSDGLLKVIAESFVKAEDEVVISYPTFVEYIFVANMMGANLVRVMMDDYHQNLPALTEAASEKTKLLFLTNPHNPAGTLFTADEFDELMNKVPDNVIVVVDEAYFEYVDDKAYPDTLEYIKKGYPIILLRTFSKAYGLAGLRIGYAVADPDIIAILKRMRDPFNVNRIAQKAAAAALDDKEFLEKTLEINEKGKKYLYQEFEKRGLDYVPTQSNFIMVKVNMDSMKLFKDLMKEGIIIRPGKPLGYPEHIRVSIGLPEENELFIEHVDKLIQS
ncbi:MAG: histidinol-phosphate transaminase [Halothermotrichaceae bacterium]